jgi:hypothetical protein
MVVRASFLFLSLAGAALLFAPARSPAETVIPFAYREGLIWVKVKADDGGGPLNFLLDSGAGASVLNLPTARKLGVRLGAAERVRMVGTEEPARRVIGFRATVAGVPVSQSPLAVDLQSTSDLCRVPIDGLLGHDFFRDRIVQIDFKAGCIRLLDRADDRRCCAVVSLRLDHGAFCVPVSINGARPRWTRLDTGCDDALHWVTGTGGTSAQASLRLGDETIANVTTALHRTELFPAEAGLLGNGVLSNYRVTIDAVNRRLLLERS